MSNVVAKADHLFASPPTAVYAAWLDPAAVQRWMTLNLASRPGGGEVTRIEIDPVVGGRYRFAGLQDGKTSDAWGYYRELDPGRRLVFTWFVDAEEEKEDNSTVMLDLRADGEGTHATISHEMDSRWSEYLAQTASAWEGMLRAIDETMDRSGP